MDRCGCSMAAEFIETRCSLIVRTVGASDDKNFPFPYNSDVKSNFWPFTQNAHC